MEDRKPKIIVDTAIFPSYYKDFHCIASECREDCCHNWNIEMKKRDYLRLRRLDAPVELRERLHDAVHRLRERAHEDFYAGFRLNSDLYCPLRDPDGLCSLQKACGHEALPVTCTTFPRLALKTSAALERLLSPACEAVVKMLWDLPDGIDFIEEPLPKKDQYTAIPAIEGLQEWFEAIRDVCVDVLQNRAYTIAQRLLYLGMLMNKLMELDWSNGDISEWYSFALPFREGELPQEMQLEPPSDQWIFVSQSLQIAVRIEKSDWIREMFDNLGVRFYEENGESKVDFAITAYAEREAAVREHFGDLSYFYENLLVSTALNLSFPALGDKKLLWRSYVNLCNIYSFYRFATVMGGVGAPTEESIIHSVVMASRALLHNKARQTTLRDELFDYDSATLAHMAILVSG